MLWDRKNLALQTKKKTAEQEQDECWQVSFSRQASEKTTSSDSKAECPESGIISNDSNEKEINHLAFGTCRVRDYLRWFDPLFVPVLRLRWYGGGLL